MELIENLTAFFSKYIREIAVALTALGLFSAIMMFRIRIKYGHIRRSERVPPGAAIRQIDLGNALFRLGVQDRGTVLLEQAVVAYRAALDELTRERVPLDWAMTQSNLGNALQTLGARESGTARLEEAVVAFRAALEELTRERVPLDWAYSEHALANALAALAKRQKSVARMEEALTCMRGAVEVYQQGKETYQLPIAQRRVTEMEAELLELQH